MDRFRTAVAKTGNFLADALGPNDSDYELLQASSPVSISESLPPAPVFSVSLTQDDHQTMTTLKELSDMPVGDRMERRATAKFIGALVFLALLIMMLFLLAWYLFWSADSSMK